MQLNNVCVRFGTQRVLDGFSLSLPRRGVVALMGPSGVGKTTLLRVMMGLERVESGTVDRGGARIACLFQEDRLLPWLTAAENVAAVLPRGEQALARRTLAELGLPEEAADKTPDALSGGMRRRVALARMVCYDGDIWLMDEAFKGLDVDSKQRVMDTLAPYAEDRLLVVVTHDRAEAAYLGAQVIELDGPPARVIEKR